VARRPAQLFAAFSDPRTRLNLVLGTYVDPYAGAPDDKVTAVRVAPGASGDV